MIHPLTSGQKGRISELKTHIAAIERGYSVFFDPTNSAPYDLVFELEGSLLRIQVKTACKSPKSQTPVTPIGRNNSSGKKVRYPPTAFEFLISVYGDEFWIFPMAVIQTYSSNLSLNPKNRQYLNAWHLIEAEAARRSTAAYLGYPEGEAEIGDLCLGK